MFVLSLDDDCIIFIRVLKCMCSRTPLNPRHFTNFIFLLYSLLLQKLKDSCLGCHVRGIFEGAIGYADDLALVSRSLSGLCQMIYIYEQYSMEYSIVLTL